LKIKGRKKAGLVLLRVGYRRELTGENMKPVRRVMLISKDSRDHSPEVYNEVIIPRFRGMKPAPALATTRFGAGVHCF